MADNEVCVICMDSVHDRAVVKSCKHAFCKECIWSWAKAKHTCPLCNSPFNFLLIRTLGPNGKESIREIEAPVITENLAQNDMVTDLQALDQNYFKSEVRRLLFSAETKQQSLAKNRRLQTHSMFGVSSVDAWEERNWQTLLKIISTLKNFAQVFESENSFDPRSTLHELYSIQDSIQAMWRDPYQVSATEVESQASRYGADDYDNMSSDEEDEYEERYNSKKNRKPNGRAPQQKNQIKRK